MLLTPSLELYSSVSRWSTFWTIGFTFGKESLKLVKKPLKQSGCFLTILASAIVTMLLPSKEVRTSMPSLGREIETGKVDEESKRSKTFCSRFWALWSIDEDWKPPLGWLVDATRFEQMDTGEEPREAAFATDRMFNSKARQRWIILLQFFENDIREKSAAEVFVCNIWNGT
mmetsp:Transcript_20488/g.26884  ORF Transcript_20488/g.26884 Transcript_20488/m.26884 type:complete len:172 (+) Transcript_20488:509-1024(+)